MAKDLTFPPVSIRSTPRAPGPALLLFLVLWLACFPSSAYANTDHEVYFRNTDYELHVYEIRGDYPGNTMLIIGGMHNEPGGYLSADLYADFSLYQGTLLVVPRANFPVIVSNNRKIHSDMNRRFTNGKKRDSKDSYEESVVEILKALMSRSDVLLNLHDGSGFYRPTYETRMKNPKRWGQCIITDTDAYGTPEENRLYLKTRVEKVLAVINPRISDGEHRFHHNNTRTFESDSPHKEQRGSATYYALTEFGIESYGVETSKNIRSLDQKVRYQSMIINAFMKEFEIIPSTPKVSIDDPQLEYLLVSVNGSFPYGIPNNKTLHLNPGDRIRVEHIAANYERGLMADIQGLGSLNDMNKEFVINKPRRILVKKDQFECGKIYLSLNAKDQPDARLARADEKVKTFLVRVNNVEKNVSNGKTIGIAATDVLILKDIRPALKNHDSVKVNFVGFVGNKSVNDAEDRGYEIRPRNLWKRYSLDKKGKLYKVEATLHDQPIGEIYVHINTPGSTR
jgi:hypothetical protein